MTGLLITCCIFNMPNNKKNVSCFTTYFATQKKDAVRAVNVSSPDN